MAKNLPRWHRKLEACTPCHTSHRPGNRLGGLMSGRLTYIVHIRRINRGCEGVSSVVEEGDQVVLRGFGGRAEPWRRHVTWGPFHASLHAPDRCDGLPKSTTQTPASTQKLRMISVEVDLSRPPYRVSAAARPAQLPPIRPPSLLPRA